MSTKPASYTAVDENSRLLNSDALSAIHDTMGNGNGHGDGNGHISFSRDSTAMTFLFDSKYTPGIDNRNVALRLIAYTWHTTKASLFSNHVNVLLFMVPLGIITGKLGWNSTAVFTINFVAIIPLAAVLSFATEQISMNVGETLGGL
ncbi:hypothetical protein FANTH_14895, partial [Fusarium anthophilum]